MAEKNRKVFLGKSEISFLEGEVFRPINGHTYVSNFGRIINLNARGYFCELTPIVTKRGTLQVGIREKFEYTGAKRKCYQVARLVLSAFVGGYYKQRPIHYLDGNPENCAIENLEWLNGFQNGIDFCYLENLKNYLLEPGDVVVKKVLLYEQDWLLMDYIKTKKNYLQKILYDDFNNIVSIDFLIDETYRRTLEKINNGRYIPTSIRSRKYKNRKFHLRKDDRLLRYIRTSALDFLYHYNRFKPIGQRTQKKVKYSSYEEEYHDISEEISSMFSSFS